MAKGIAKVRPPRGLGPTGGDPMTGHVPTKDELRRFWSRVDKHGERGCWLWTSYTRRGYGSIYFAGKERRAHRVSCVIHGIPLPLGLVIDHLCKNTGCVNPAHFRFVTQGENSIPGLIKLRGYRRGRPVENTE
jgi:hypothetical protein